MDLELAGKRVVVTGAGQGLGRATAQAFAREGARLCLVGRTAASLEETQASLVPVAGGHRVEVTDLAEVAGVEQLAARLEEAWHGVDVLVNNACSHSALRRVATLEEAAWDAFVGDNLRAVYALTRRVVPGMAARGFGRVVNVGSLTAEVGGSHYADYATVKAGLLGLTRTLALEHSRQGVTVNVVEPGFIGTERFKQAAPASKLELFARATAVGRIAEPHEVGDVIVFLASPRASYITGATVTVGGGLGLNTLW